MEENEDLYGSISDSVPIVIDTGSRFTRIGYAGDEKPKAVIPTLVGRPKPNLPPEFMTKKFYFGEDARRKRGLLLVKRPIESGIVTNWSDMDEFWQHTFDEVLEVESENHGVILTEPPLIPVANRERSAQVMFERFKVQYLYLAASPVMALLSTGRTTGVVLDSGDSVTHAIPVYEGHHIPHACTHTFVGGDDVTSHLRSHGFDFLSNAVSDYDFIREFKEKNCFVVTDVEKQAKESKKSFEMYDGSLFHLGHELYDCAECLFKPKYDENNGMQQCLYNAIQKCDFGEDFPEDYLFKNILLSGGNTKLKGFKERMKNELTSLTQNSIDIEINAPMNRDEISWIGASEFASSANFCDEIAVSRSEYEEYGPHVVYRYCF